MSETISLEEQRDATLNTLEEYLPTWAGYRQRYERTAGLDARLSGEWRVVSNHMDYLLERYFMLMGDVTLEAEYA